MDVWGKKRKGKLVWLEEKNYWQRSWWCREDQRVVGGGNDG
jgi:hypothetical protein